MNRLSILWDSLDIRHFSFHEVTRGKEVPDEYALNIIPTIKYVDFMRRNLKFPIAITSSFRTLQYHIDLYLSMGVSKDKIPMQSLHLVFNALDILPVSGTKVHLQRMQKFAQLPFSLYYNIEGRTVEFDNSDMGVGFYQTFLHVDSRGTLDRPSPAFWGNPIYS